jgi:hypothetical protein
MILGCNESGLYRLNKDDWLPLTNTYSHPNILKHHKTIVLGSQAKQVAVSAGLQKFRAKDAKQLKGLIDHVYEALTLTADSQNVVRLFAISASKSKNKDQGCFMEKICEIKLEASLVIKAIDFYTNFNAIVVTTESDVIRITHNLIP